jgi:ribosomal 50S subunit-recycling heat shock protein
VRLDIFLKRTCLVKQRTLAKEACERGEVRVDGREARPSKDVGPGHIITIEADRQLLEIEVVGLPTRNYKRKDGEAFYRVREARRKELL